MIDCAHGNRDFVAIDAYNGNMFFNSGVDSVCSEFDHLFTAAEGRGARIDDLRDDVATAFATKKADFTHDCLFLLHLLDTPFRRECALLGVLYITR